MNFLLMPITASASLEFVMDTTTVREDRTKMKRFVEVSKTHILLYNQVTSKLFVNYKD